MQIRTGVIRCKKLFPFTISRGTSTEHNNLFVRVDSGGHFGLGECAPRTGFADTLAGIASDQILAMAEKHDLSSLSIYETYDLARALDVDPSGICALDSALWDLEAKKAGMPLYRMLGLGLPKVSTSVTIGIEPAEVVRERVPILLNLTGAKYLKVKLGSKEGEEHDRAIYSTAQEIARARGVQLRVDANGGWDVPRAIRTMKWLAERECDYVEQPLEKGQESDLVHLFEGRPLPIFVDESVWFASDVPAVVHYVDGVNLKLMKCGGITEALRIVGLCRAYRLQTMIGCMSEGSIGIAPGAAIGALFDHIDLDSQTNLNPDPAEGLILQDGIVLPPSTPGHGATLKPEFELFA